MSDEGEKTCPLCAEEMDITDQQLKPCKCGYEICVWCWHHIMDMAEKDDTEGRCPACRSAYDKEKIVGMAANCERMVADVGIERKKSQKAKTKPSEGRKQLSSVRVIQRNLVYIVGLPLTLADEELLQQREYFGQYGKVLKVSMSRTATGVIQQFPNSTCSVYITYGKEEEAVRCIQSVHGFVLDGRSLKACFGTTKYCHAWLRNVPCTNPDCLYLHEVGSQEDSFTKDEIISAYTRSRVQQITGATINLLRRAGSMLPPPVDDYNNSASAAKPIARSASSNTSTTGRSSPPNGSSGRSIGLPAAASWGMRASNLPPAVGQACSNGPSKPKLEAPSGSTIAFSAAVAGTTQASPLLSDATKRSGWFDESPIINSKGKSDAAKPVKRLVSMDGRSSILEKPASDNGLSAGLLSNRSSPITTKYNDWGNSASQSTSNSIHPAHGGTSTKERTVARDGQVQNSGIDLSSVRLDTNVRNEVSGISRTSSSLSEQSSVKSPSNQVPQQPFLEQYRDPLSTPATENNAARTNSTCTSGEHISLRLDLQSKKVADAASVAEEDVISFDNQRLKDPEIVSRSSYLQNSANPLHAHRHSRSRSLQHSEAFSPLNPNADSLYIDSRVGDSSPHHSSTNFALPNGYSRKPVSSTGGFDKNVEHSYLFSNDRDVKHIARPQADNDSNVSPDVGESSIISNILSLDLDPWDDSLTSPHNFVKLLAESDKQSSTLKLSSSRKPQSSNQSRFSFARQEGPATNQAFDVDSSYSNFSQLHQNRSFSQDYVDSRNPYMDHLGTVNGFSSNFEEPGSFSSSLPAVSSNKPSMSRVQIPVPPGFTVPSRAPPPGFSSHERVEQNFELLSGNHLFDSSLPRNSYQAPSAGNISNSGDIEFIDPAILAVGKGRFQGGLNNQVLDMRGNFPQQLSAFENEARLQLLMQRSLSPHQNLRYADAGGSFSSLSDSYGISSRLVDPPQVNNLAPFAQLSLQQSRNGLVSNGLWDGWNEVQGGNNIGMTELLRNERLGFNKFYGAAGYEDSKFRIATSGDLYNRTFEM